MDVRCRSCSMVDMSCGLGFAHRMDCASGSVRLLLSSLGPQGRRWFFTQTWLAVAAAATWLLLFVALPALWEVPASLEGGRLSSVHSVGSRWILWRLSMEAMIANPFLGLGPAHFAYAYNGEGAHPHNFWLQLAAEWGAPAALLSGFVAVAVFLRLRESVRQENLDASREVGIALLAALIVWGVGTQADGYMVVPTSQVASTILAVFVVAWLRSDRAMDPQSGSRRLLNVPLCAFAFVAIALLSILLVQLKGDSTRDCVAHGIPGRFFLAEILAAGLDRRIEMQPPAHLIKTRVIFLPIVAAAEAAFKPAMIPLGRIESSTATPSFETPVFLAM